jgi:hypothetical protein
MKRIGAGIAVIVAAVTLVPPPARAQNASAWLFPQTSEPVESAGAVEVTVKLWRAGRVAYRTFDGSCTVTYSPAGSPPDASCSAENAARAPGDYTATSGELVFTQGGTKTLRLPIVDDGLAEDDEAFTLVAWEEVNADPWIDRGDSAVLRIIDDDEGKPAASAGRTTTPDGRSSSSAAGRPASMSGAADGRATSDTTAASSPNLEVALPASKLRAGPGFELTSGGPPEPAPARGGERDGGGGSTSWLAFGLGTAALIVGAATLAQRRRRWSPTQA